MAMQQALQIGRWPNVLISSMLHYNALHANHLAGNHVMNDFILSPNLTASCHPNAIMFANVVAPGSFPGDNAFGLLPAGKQDGAAAADVALGQAALGVNDRLVWVKYGLHSFVLLTGHHNILETFEAWAGGGGGYEFHQSVCNEPDDVGHPRVVGGRLLLTRAIGAAALADLIDANYLVRGVAANRMSRGGHGGFGGHTFGSAAPGIDIHVVNSAGLAAFGLELTRRLVPVGFYRALAVQRAQGGLVCCHCQVRVANRPAAHTAVWRECGTCNRYYCRQCKHLLLSRARRTVFHTRVRICDCGQNTSRI
jgi:hypothetical protein